MTPKAGSVTLGGVKIHLPDPATLKPRFIGDDEALRLLAAAWSVYSKTDHPMSPAIQGKSGVGKTTLALFCAQSIFKLPAWIFSCTSETEPEELIAYPVADEKKGLQYMASPILAAMVNGGALILEDASRLSEKAWSTLAPLLDERRYLESPELGIRIVAKESFRFVATLSEGSLVYHLPDFIHSRLAPRLTLHLPSQDDIKDILRHHVELADEKLVEKVAAFVKNAPTHVSLRDGNNILSFASKLHSSAGIPLERAFDMSLEHNLRPGRLDLVRPVKK